MSIKEAQLILNVGIHANEQKILAAHRKMMFNNHPDNGGSNFLAMKVNEAKTLLLKEK